MTCNSIISNAIRIVLKIIINMCLSLLGANRNLFFTVMEIRNPRL